MRNPKWSRDEIILALNLYFSPDRGTIDSNNPKIVALSGVLNKLPIFSVKPDEERFRNPNGVTLKLSNFAAFDPNYPGKGMTSGSKLDKEIFDTYKDHHQELAKIAAEIMLINNDPELRRQISQIEDDEISENDSVSEGRILYKMHKQIERSRSIVEKKKKQTLERCGSLVCEVCSFDFSHYYGEIGFGYIECHHRVPLASIQAETTTKPEDLALVCANCHRMLHRQINVMSIEALRATYQQQVRTFQ